MGTELLFNSEELYSLIFSLVTNLKVLVVIFSGPKLYDLKLNIKYFFI